MTGSRTQGAVLRADLPIVAKRLAWEFKYRWLNYGNLTGAEDVVQWILGRTPPIRNLAELGCGRGALLRALRSRGWTGSYCGIDICSKAIADAVKVNDQRSSWVVSDFQHFKSPFKWDAIAMVESIYYLGINELIPFLDHLQEMLNDDGVLVFRFHDLDKHRIYIDALEQYLQPVQRMVGNLRCFQKLSAKLTGLNSQDLSEPLQLVEK